MPYSKYRAIPTFVDNIRFASKKEAKRYGELKLLLKANKICVLEWQVPFYLKVERNDFEREIIIGKYIADFTYWEHGELIVEDTKGYRTPLYNWKKRHFEAQYGIKIKET